MTKDEKQIIGWAFETIKELNSICTTMVPEYEPFNSDETRRFAQLERLASGIEVVEDDCPERYEAARARIGELSDVLARVRALVE